jgi:ATP-dependent Clp protease adapter protein ClpS
MDILVPLICYTSRQFDPVRIGSEPSARDSEDSAELYEVRIMDNDHNTYQQVMDITMLALDFGEDEAYAVAWEVDHRGSCVVAVGPFEQADSIATVIRTIGIEVRVDPIAGGRA